MSSLKIVAIVLTGLWLSMCTHTGSPGPAKPEKKETTENTEESRTNSPDRAESETKKAQGKSQTSQPSIQDETGPESEETAEDGNQSRKTTSTDAADAGLQEARDNLQTSRETERRISSELEHLKKSGTASAETIKDYEEYLARVRAMTAENRKIMEQMEAAYQRHTAGETSSNSAVSDKRDKMFDPNIPEEQTMDEVAALDKEFNESLAKFDDRLLKEMDAIRAESAKKLQDLAQEAADAAKRLRDKGVDVDTSGAGGSSQEADTQKETSGGGRETETAGGADDAETASRDGSRKGGKGGSADDRHRTDYEDDDIVARQLREAAENETDPELKEKLWKEYEEYKQGR
jgi:hypothetical protein